jgi:hypothetical protein
MDTRFSRHNLRQGPGLVPIFFQTKATTHPGSLETWLLERLLKEKEPLRRVIQFSSGTLFLFLRTSFLSLGIFDTFLLHNIIVSLFFFRFDFCFLVRLRLWPEFGQLRVETVVFDNKLDTIEGDSSFCSSRRLLATEYQ